MVILAPLFFRRKEHKVDICSLFREPFKMSENITFSEYVEAGPKLLSGNRLIQATFRASPLHVTVANVIRRQILAAVPTVGFKTEPPEHSDVYIEANTTPLVNEMLMHRIGMIPICVKDVHNFKPEEYEFGINIENVGNTPVHVTASDFTITRTYDGKVESVPTAQFFPPDPITGETQLITILRPKYNLDSLPERLILKATASIGTGRQNMRYSPVAQCSYEYTPDKDVSKQKAILADWLANSKKVPDSSAISAERLEELTREFNCLEIQRCFKKNEKGEPYDFLFHIESVGVLSVPDIISRGIKACETIVAPYVDFDTQFPLKPDGLPLVTVNKAVRRMEGSFEFVFEDQEHTLGNLLQTFLVERHIEGKEQPKLTYVGYKVPHPLKAEMVLLVATEDGQELTARQAIANVCKYLKGYFAETKESWDKAPKGAEEPAQAVEPVQAAQAVEPVQAAQPAQAVQTKKRGTKKTGP
jgi:DNA-directed RNA polymerase subunit L/DNA-directed RNA polymerase alpha subunit